MYVRMSGLLRRPSHSLPHSLPRRIDGPIYAYGARHYSSHRVAHGQHTVQYNLTTKLQIVMKWLFEWPTH